MPPHSPEAEQAAQRKTAVRVANVPAEISEHAVESDDPSTVTKLDRMGKRSWPVPEGIQQATHLLGRKPDILM
jgi:hypothetical protein